MVILAVVFGGCCIAMIDDQTWVGIIFLCALWGIIIASGLALRYEIKNDELVIRCGFLRYQKIPIQTIRKITETNNPLSAPAFSLDRLEILYNKFDTVLISPKNKKGFIVHLTKLNANIEVKLKKKTVTPNP